MDEWGAHVKKSDVGMPLTSHVHPSALSRIIKRGRVLNRKGTLHHVVSTKHVPGLVFCNPSKINGAAITHVVTRQSSVHLRGLGNAATSATSVGTIIRRLSAFTKIGNVLLCLSRVRCFGGHRRRALLRCVRGNHVALVTSAARGPCFCICGTVLDHSAIFRFGTIRTTSVIPTIRHNFSFLHDRQRKTVAIRSNIYRRVTISYNKSIHGTLGTIRLYILTKRISRSNIAIALSDTHRLSRHDTVHCSQRNSRRCSVVSTCRGSVHNSSPSTTLRCLTQLLRTKSLPSTYHHLLIYTGRSINLTCPVVVPVIGTTISATLRMKLPRTQLPLTGTIILIYRTPGSGTTRSTVLTTYTSIRTNGANPIPHRLRGGRCSNSSITGGKRFCRCPRTFPSR